MRNPVTPNRLRTAEGKSMIVTVKGDDVVFESAFTSDEDALTYLREHITSHFASDLVRRADGWGLSAKQWAWVHKLATDASRPQPPSVPVTLNLRRIVEMMDLAAAAQKRLPTIRLETTHGQPVVLKRAGERSRDPGSINVTDGRPFGDNKWYGRIDRDGDFHASRQCRVEHAELLTQLAQNPESVATQHGIATGTCCFCSRLLSTRESRVVGYGPICAARYGLPWGSIHGYDSEDQTDG